MKLEDFKARTCSNSACWRNRGFRDGGVDVELGAGWKCFMIEKHCANRHRCVRRPVGEYNDAIGVHQQDSNITFRIIEAKANGKISAALPQLQKGADYLDRAIGSERAEFTAEVHTLPGPRTSIRVAKFIEIKSRRQRVLVTRLP